MSGFWETFRERCLAVNPECYFVGEIWEHAPDWLNGRFDGLMNYPLGAAILGFAGGEHLHGDTIRAHHTYRRTIRQARAGRVCRCARTTTRLSIRSRPSRRS